MIIFSILYGCDRKRSCQTRSFKSEKPYLSPLDFHPVIFEIHPPLGPCPFVILRPPSTAQDDGRKPAAAVPSREERHEAPGAGAHQLAGLELLQPVWLSLPPPPSTASAMQPVVETVREGEKAEALLY